MGVRELSEPERLAILADVRSWLDSWETGANMARDGMVASLRRSDAADALHAINGASVEIGALARGVVAARVRGWLAPWSGGLDAQALRGLERLALDALLQAAQAVSGPGVRGVVGDALRVAWASATERLGGFASAAEFGDEA